ncbi:sugar transferase [Flavobacterium sp. MFBS3-15]|uniref:sugar transferase n=1 Tax=Flavobacterium sp. MFBS3-15 TaxID=2989816 RepID=UPI002236A088|nr:sugar transferase [Flavobacterium sp. MFBS3-15]MCW4469585.1 sugar transferase [Flavobacterium sp. MFBS3-15]
MLTNRMFLEGKYCGRKMFIKRIMDVLGALLGLIIMALPAMALWLGAAVSTHSGGMFMQKRIGRWGIPFTIYKFRTMGKDSYIINTFSAFLRRNKLDELPQLWNVLKGDMSIVGPRPDIPGYYDMLIGENRKILELRPGITGPASLKYSNEDQILLLQENPMEYNDTVIFPDKVKINLQYYKKQNFWLDIKIIYITLSGGKCNIDNFFKD